MLLQLGGLLDEASLELFESQSHLLDADSLAALQKQRQLLEWQQGSVGDEANTLAAAASLERQDSAGSGNEPMEVRWAGVRWLGSSGQVPPVVVLLMSQFSLCLSVTAFCAAPPSTNA